MLDEVHAGLQRLFWERGNIDANVVDIAFDAPTRDFIDRLLRPTLCFFLYDMRENTDLRQSNFPSVRANGQAERRMPPRRVDLGYLVTGLSSAASDEQELLWRAMVTLLKYPDLPGELLAGEMQTLEPAITMRLWKDGGSGPTDLWSALSARPHPSLMLTVTVPVDLDIAITSPLVLTRTVRYGRTGPDGSPAGERITIGGVVLDAARQPVGGAVVTLEGSGMPGARTNERGEFSLAGVASGSVTLRVVTEAGVDERVALTVPAERYELVLGAGKRPRTNTK